MSLTPEQTIECLRTGRDQAMAEAAAMRKLIQEFLASQKIPRLCEICQDSVVRCVLRPLCKAEATTTAGASLLDRLKKAEADNEELRRQLDAISNKK